MNFVKNSNLEAFILGFIYFEDDTIFTVTLTPHQETEMQQKFKEFLSEGDSEWENVNVKNHDDAYYKIQLTRENDRNMFENFLTNELSNIIEEVQFGYYHHRAIFKLVFNSQANFQEVRNRRSKIHKLIRERCFDKFKGQSIGNDKNKITIRYIYSYTLFIIPDGQKILDEEIKELKKVQYDPMFSIRTSAFGFPLAGNQVLSSILGISHYVRISVPGTIVYLRGKKLNSSLLSYVIDGIYYGGLYGKIRMDRNDEKANGSFKPVNDWSQDLMIETYKILKDTVSIQALSYVSSTIDRLALLVAVSAIVIALVSLIPIFQNDKLPPLQPTSNTTTNMKP